MFCSAKMIAQEIGCTPRTVMAHVRQMELEGYHIRAKIGRPVQINRTMFMLHVFGPGWEDEKNGKD